jgi:hypothetical protein
MWHTKWKGLARLQETDAGVNLHESSCRVLEIACCYDQLQVGALASMELICRQVQMVEERWKDKVLGQVPESSSENYLYSGLTNRGALCIAPELSTWISEQLKSDSAVMKEKRKAREERNLSKPKKDG